MKQHWIGYVFALLIGFTCGYWIKPDLALETQAIPEQVIPAQEASTETKISNEKETGYPEPSNPEPKEVESKSDAAEKIELDQLKSYSLQEAIDLFKSNMEDIQGIGVSKGTAIFAYWASFGLKWNELLNVPKGKYGLVMKDSLPQLGKRLCVNGRVIEIERDKTIDQPMFTGGMFDEVARIYRFVAIGSTGEIVANSQAGFCGIVTGQQHYPNSAGGMSHAVTLVGMFDLPENNPGNIKKKSK